MAEKKKKIIKKDTLKHFVDQAGELVKQPSIEEIKQQHSLVELFTHYGVDLRKNGTPGEWHGLCPFHDDKNPSLSVNEAKGVFYCHSGACGEKGDIFTLVEKKEGIKEFKDVLNFLKNMKPSLSSLLGEKKDSQPETEMNPSQKEIINKSENIDKDILLSKVADYYHKTLLGNEKAKEYLKSRGLLNLELINRFKIGFADGTLLHKVGEKGFYSLKEYGIYNKHNMEHFNNCITFPIFDNFGMVKSIYGRNINDGATFKHLYLKGDRKGIFNRKASKVYPDQIILAESIIDALSLIQIGFENVQCIYGTNGFTDEHLEILKEDNVKQVVLAFDRDEAGLKTFEKIKEKLLKEGFQVKVIYPMIEKDWNDELVKNKITKEEIRFMIEKSKLYKPEKDDFDVKEENSQWTFTINDVAYRLTGVREVFVSNLKVVIRATFKEDCFVDTVDLYQHRSRLRFASHLAGEFGISNSKIERDLKKILNHLEQERDKKLFPDKDKDTQMSEQDRILGEHFLKSKNMFNQLIEDMDWLGYAGEDINKLVMYLASTSRKMDNPISLLVISQSGAGKSHLVDTTIQLLPEEDVIVATSLSDQALNYMTDLKHKFLDLGEAVHSSDIEHQIREMLSGKKLSRQVTTKDEKTGQMITRAVKKECIVSVAMSSTDHSIHPENATRVFIINTDESAEQTKKIHIKQREEDDLEYFLEKQRRVPEIIRKHLAAQRLLKKMRVFIPYSKELDFPLNLSRLRRDHKRFNDLIKAVAFLRQKQKEVRKLPDGSEYIYADEEDYLIAYNILKGILKSTINDIPHQSAQLYEKIRKIVREKAKKEDLKVDEIALSQREIREATGFSQMFVKRYIRTLVEFEYLGLKRGVQGGRNTYFLLADEDLEEVDMSMIPKPSEIKGFMQKWVSKHG